MVTAMKKDCSTVVFSFLVMCLIQQPDITTAVWEI